MIFQLKKVDLLNQLKNSMHLIFYLEKMYLGENFAKSDRSFFLLQFIQVIFWNKDNGF